MDKKNIIKESSRFLLNKYLKKLNVKNIFLVTGKNSYKNCGAKEFIDSLKKKYNFIRYHQFQENPKYEEAVLASKSFKEKKIDLIISIGGGSVIDMGKLIRLISLHKGTKEQFLNNKFIINQDLCPFIALPTTAGTGSEETDFAVVYSNKLKYSIMKENLKPSLSLIDPYFTKSTPKYLSASAGFDALTQSIESYWSINSSKESRKLSKRSIKIILNFLKEFIFKKTTKSRFQMALASNLSGQAINFTKTTAPHALSYEITQSLKIPHGHAVALTLGRFFIINEYNKNVQEKKKKIKEIMDSLFRILGVKNAKQAFKFWYNFMTECGLEIDYKKLGLKKKKIILKIIDNVNLERLSNHPVKINSEDLKSLFYDFE